MILIIDARPWACTATRWKTHVHSVITDRNYVSARWPGDRRHDLLGHLAGDATLRAVAERLTAVTREGDTVAGMGGDELAIVLAGLDHPRGTRPSAGKQA